ncbi:MAG: hypothetical protein SF051_00530 [Elusimicrobiota bacterium]|nr:hypothetical protein [Elusimicrobiota bacterium]
MLTHHLVSRLAVAAAAVSALATVAMGAGAPASFLFALWSAAPFLALWQLARVIGRPAPLLGAALTGIVGQAAVFAAVSWSSSSTAPLALLFAPGYQLVVIMPAGALSGLVLGGVWEKGGTALRGLLALAAAGALVFEFLAIAAPHRLPMNAARARAALQRIGEPRVVRPGAFETVTVSTASAWFQALELDGRPGDELAVVDGRGARLLDGATFAPIGFEPFTGEPGRLWSWMTQLVPMEDGLAAVQTGGGFSATVVQRLDGTTLWSYKPDARLNPTALIPADLEGDRDWEFYAASNEKLARLDLDGKEVWSVPAVSPALLGALPRRGSVPAMVGAYEYGRRAFAVDEKGAVLGGYALSSKDMPFAFTDTPWGRAFLHAGKARPLRGVAPDGRELFSVPLGDFSAIAAVGLRLKAGPALAVLGASTESVGRFRLLIVGEGGAPLYDEVLAAPPALRALRRPDGTTALLLIKDGLRVIRE